jgi:hypothetical protein
MDESSSAPSEQSDALGEMPAQPEENGTKPAELGAGVRGILTTTQDRVAEILVATETAAAEIVDAANAESEQIVRDTHATAESLAQSRIDRIDSVTDAVLTKASELESEIDALRALVSRSTDTLAEDLGIERTTVQQSLPEPEEDESVSEDEEQVTVPENGASHGPNRGGLLGRMRSSYKRDTSEGVKLLATQMIAAGHSKDDVQRRLSDEFGIDPKIARDAIETGTAAR